MAVAAIMPSAVVRGVPFKWDYAPTFGSGMGDWRDAPVKPRQQIVFKPEFQIGAPLGRWECDKSSTEFTNRYNAEVERLLPLCLYPISYAWVWTRANQFRRNVRIEEKPIHVRSTGRPVDGLRLKSTPPPKQQTSPSL